MLRKSIGWGIAVGLLWTVPLTAVLYLADQLFDLPFVPFDLFNWINRILPGAIITAGIDTMIALMTGLGIDLSNAKTAEQAMAMLQFIGLLTAVVVVFFALTTSSKKLSGRTDGLLLGALTGLPLAGITLSLTQASMTPVISLLWIIIVFLGWGMGVSWTYGRVMAPEAAAAETTASAEALNRRQFLVKLGAGAATITVVGSGVGAWLATRDDGTEIATANAHDESDGPDGQPFPNANDPVVPVPGTRPEYTPLKDHYQVFINAEPTYIQEADWVLPITGLVNNPLMLTLDDLKNNYEKRDQFVTLRCISGRIGTTLISTTQWSGVSAQELLADADLQDDAQYLHIFSGDGYYETVDLDLIRNDERIMFCYEWDGNDLPKDHGFPLRIWIPDRYGMKQPKWITRIEVSSEYTPGYWVERNWDKEAIVKATSVIDVVAVDNIIEQNGERLIPIGGIAYAGARGVSRVDVRVNGREWQEAQLRTPLSETTWVIWRYEWPFQSGEHLFEVRMFEADGTMQILESTDNRPDGATGIHSVEATVS